MEFSFLAAVASGLLSWGHFISSNIIDFIAQTLFKLNWAGRWSVKSCHFTLLTHYFPILILCSCFVTICIVKSAINKGDLTWLFFKNIARIRCFVSSQALENQNAAASILTRTRQSEHITPVLRSLHWLPVTFRIDFKVLLLVYKSLNGLGHKYIADILTEYKPNRPFRSVGSSQLEIPRVQTKQGESAFSYFTARSWNQHPEEIRCAKTLATFKSRLKTRLFSCAFVEWALCYVQTDCTMYNNFLFLTVLSELKKMFLYIYIYIYYYYLIPCF